AERSRRLGNLCGTVCYEEETYPRRVMHKSPNAIITEAALAIASGCDTVSFYWADGEKPERIEDYERFVKAIARARGYFERLSASTLRTSLGGVARCLGSKAFEQDGFSLSDAADLALARCGIPVTVAESASKHKVWYASDRSRKAMTEADFAKVKAEGLFEFVPETYPLVSTRQRWLDEIDRASGGRFPVRIDLPHALRVLPRIDAAGKTDSVTLLNLSIGDTDAFTVKIRNPRRLKPVLASPQHPDVTLECVHDASRDELQVVVPGLAGWQICTIFI
ncbi:MAG: hypothetical protein PHN34_10595, partial [Kiritimatiellae bacterium]|nr:hypothetical protein [Kiritimatiellia bacterium]